MFNTPLALFHDRADAEVSLGELREAYADYLRGREKPASAKTIAHYLDTLLSFEKSLTLHGKPAVLGQLTPANVRTWVSDQRAGRLPSHSTRPQDEVLRPDDSSAPRGDQVVQPQVRPEGAQAHSA